ncbi:S23 ribosomal protein [Nostoc commune NIES-4072]|uniref:S23 ribosomal protein n=1 Tax=Nostoc commune NIES-4072 TaxID=2005467 RepID=A0A2R5FUZ2_NOSCO|nr:four helix bundle protein [Nostoc commune]BBD65278.1 S23 ribosomal protein [Nostoc commune HK-02]BBD70962.1 S23 ribosomal protein [Nostoc commune HK-02]GBG17398.1 S23 ribosomal protein [Nostoc commune NIES-4072]GBG18712.1 S23 ribosomal protein [Nostoc commune NIES-4072]GBG19651.1 S23 ribosomal protein [Nostoc commune NIES-4072]
MDKEEERRKIITHEDLIIYQKAFQAAITIFEISKRFPEEERYSLTDQIRRSSRSVCANLAEAWRKRRYKASFIAKLNECEAEAAETQVWLKFALRYQYLSIEEEKNLSGAYNQVLSGLVKMINQPEDWLIG